VIKDIYREYPLTRVAGLISARELGKPSWSASARADDVDVGAVDEPLAVVGAGRPELLNAHQILARRRGRGDGKVPLETLVLPYHQLDFLMIFLRIIAEGT
jgi:hypothetical protein